MILDTDQLETSVISFSATKRDLKIIAIHVHYADPLGSYSFIEEIRGKITGVEDPGQKVNVNIRLIDLPGVVRAMGKYEEVNMTDFNKGLKDTLFILANQLQNSEDQTERYQGEYIFRLFGLIQNNIKGYLDSKEREAETRLKLI